MEIPRILQILKVHCRIHKSQPPVPILSQMGPDYAPTRILEPILILSFHLRLGLPSGLLPSGVSTKILYAPLLSLYLNYYFLIPHKPNQTKPNRTKFPVLQLKCKLHITPQTEPEVHQSRFATEYPEDFLLHVPTTTISTATEFRRRKLELLEKELPSFGLIERNALHCVLLSGPEQTGVGVGSYYEGSLFHDANQLHESGCLPTSAS
jgi:hypothetical protein